MALTDRELKILSLVCDTIVPKVRTGSSSATESTRDFYERSASDVGVDKALAEIIETKLEPSLREQFHRLLGILDSRLYNLILTGKPVRFAALEAEGERTKYLQGWRDSSFGSKRQAFQAMKRLVCFLFYTMTDGNGLNPNWKEIGYPGPQVNGPMSHPESLRIRPIEIGNGAVLQCDVCVVGSGAGGSVIAHELSSAGYDVIVVESGGYETAETFDQGELSMMNKLFDEYGTAATNDLSLILLAGRGAGGGTTVNWMTCIRPSIDVLEQWENEFGIQGLTGAEFQAQVDEVWNTLKVNLAESQMNLNNEVLWRGCRSLGYREGEEFEMIWRNALGCKERCAFCTYGCVYSCKQSTLLNYLPMAFMNGARFLFNTKVERVVIERGVARGVEGRCTLPGRSSEVRIRARVVVAACGSIKTPALLLKSGIRSKNVGRYLRLHPTTAVTGRFRQEVRAWEGPPQTVVVTKFLNLDNTGHGFWMEAAPAHPGLFAMSAPWSDGMAHKDFMKERFNHSTANIVLLREWGSGEVGLNGHGSAVVSYRLDRKDRENMLHGIRETAKILVAAGAVGLSTLHSDLVEISSTRDALTQNDLDRFSQAVEDAGIGPNMLMMYSAHLMGSCRMASDESLGAVDTKGEVFGVRNLFVADASVFPTSLGANPMITIMAMSKRTSRFVINRLREGSQL